MDDPVNVFILGMIAGILADQWALQIRHYLMLRRLKRSLGEIANDVHTIIVLTEKIKRHREKEEDNG